MLAVLALAACQEPFDVDRHDLVGFRIAALSVPPADDGAFVVPRAAVIVDGAAHAGDPTDLAWFFVRGVDAIDTIDPLSPADGTGPAPTMQVPVDRRTLLLVARRGAEERRAFVEVREPPSTIGAPVAVGRLALDLDVASVTAEALQRDARAAATPSADPTVAPGGFLRLTATFLGAPADLVRWSATAGTFFELDARTADWAAGDLFLDGDEIEGERTAIEPGAVTVIALALGARDESAWLATELIVGDAPPGLWVAGRFLPTDAEVAWAPGDAVRGTLRSDPDSPVGVRLEAGVVEPAADVVDWGTAALDCLVSLDEPFDPTWLLLQFCGRDAVDGSTVALVPETPP